MSAVDYSGLGYALFFALEMCIVSPVFLLLLTLSFIDKHYKKHKLLFYIILSSTLCIAGTATFFYIFERTMQSLLIGIYILGAFIVSIPVIIAYWIYLCSLHKKRDYWILAITFAIPITGLLWLLGTY